MPDSASDDASDKPGRLRGTGTLNPHPERVRDPRFAGSDFFDSRDLLQVRYEMVRLVRIDRLTLAKAAERFGVSLPTCFRMVKAFAPQWTGQIRPFMDTANPAISGVPRRELSSTSGRRSSAKMSGPWCASCGVRT